MAGAILGAALIAAAPAQSQQFRADQAEFLDLYKELVETNTTASVGNCTLAATQLQARLSKAGFTPAEITAFAPAENPRHGGLSVVWTGSDARLAPLLLLAHLDVVEAKREDWERDPFKLVDEGGWYFARGSTDDKSQAAIFADTMIRLRAGGFRPRRTLKLALTCGEEGGAGSINGAGWLAEHRPDLLQAGFALNEGGPGRMAADGGPLSLGVQVGEKATRTFTLETFNKGGHSSVPVRDNAIYQLSDAMLKVRELKFPLRLTAVTTRYLAMMGKILPAPMGPAMLRLAADPGDGAAEAVVSSDRSFNSMLHTTCVVTMVEGGHATNALPQHAKATVNCRVLPGDSVEETAAALQRAIGDPGVKFTAASRERTLAVPPALDPAVIGPMEKLAKKHFPGVPLVPMISPGATDNTFLGPLGIPAYGIPGLWVDPETVGTHGLNERVSKQALYRGRDYMFDLIKTYAEGAK
ncbi:M20/M25/M40 family metallo-hydrolase [Novosphingobium flavum]|uniref:M20/M25/M40 family metallo-hydrolase n=1 Tax=Novosphingobium flavum TaxID=1778672 RepID=UPI001FEBD308|nr:M20/M25/M40 family metallo-hydrolase [Novosphingobium flavum]